MNATQRVALAIVTALDLAMLLTGVVQATSDSSATVGFGLLLVIGGAVLAIPLLHIWADPR